MCNFYQFTHGLYLGAASEKPIFYHIKAICKTAELGYAIGDEVDFTTGASITDTASTGYLANTKAAVGFNIGANIYVIRKDTTIGTLTQATTANWSVIVRVYTI